MLFSKVTAKAQTTLPSGVRKALGVKPGDRLAYVIEGDQAVIRRADNHDELDPALGAFLDFVEHDLATHPERPQPATVEWVEQMTRLTSGEKVDLDEEIEGPIEL